MAYINFTKETVIVLNGFEVATYVNELDSHDNHMAQYWGETSFFDLIDAAVEEGVVFRLNDDAFRDWYVQPVNRVVKYTSKEMADGELALYYVPWKGGTISNLEGIFGKGWLNIRMYTLYHTFDN